MRRIFIVPIDDKSKEVGLEKYLRDNGFRFNIPENPPKTIFDCESLEEVDAMNRGREGR